MDFVPLITTPTVGQLGQFSTDLTIHLPNPYFKILLVRVLWETVLKALLNQSKSCILFTPQPVISSQKTIRLAKHEFSFVDPLLTTPDHLPTSCIFGNAFQEDSSYVNLLNGGLVQNASMHLSAKKHRQQTVGGLSADVHEPARGINWIVHKTQ